MAQKDYAATEPAIVRDHVGERNRPDNDSVLENAQQPGNQNEVDRPQKVAHPLSGKHPAEVARERAFGHKLRNTHPGRPGWTSRRQTVNERVVLMPGIVPKEMAARGP